MTGEAQVVLAPGRRRRRLASGSHTEFLGAVVGELRSSLATLREATSVLARQGRSASAIRLADAERVAEVQTRKVEWLVRLLEAVDGGGAGRRIESVDVRTVVQQAMSGFGIGLEVKDRHVDESLRADPERVRLGVELLVGALASPSGAEVVAARLLPRVLVVKARTIDLDDPGSRWRMRAAFRVLAAEDCSLKIRAAPGGIRAEVRFGTADR